MARLQRLGTAAERPHDASELPGLLAVGVVYMSLCREESTPDRRLLRTMLDMHQQAFPIVACCG